MSDLKPVGIPVQLGGQERHLLFTLNVIDDIQSACNRDLFDAMDYVAAAGAGVRDHDTLVMFRRIVTIILNDENRGNITEEEVGRMITLENLRSVARKVMEAFGISMPEPDEDEEDEDPKAQTGQ